MPVTFYQAADRLAAAEFLKSLHSTPEHDREPPPPPKNARPLLWLVDPFRVPFAGHLWEIPPVTPFDAVRVIRLTNRLKHIRTDNEEGVGEYLAWLREALALVRRLVRPAKDGAQPGTWAGALLWEVRYRRRRLLWRLRLMRNPWRRGTEEDLGEILGFFWKRRTRSPARPRSGVASPVRST